MSINHPEHEAARFARVTAEPRPSIGFVLDGRLAEALASDTVLTAILTVQRDLRTCEFAAERRAGFCLIGACQDCWVHLSSGRALRACTSFIEPGMEIVTRDRA